MGVEGRGKCLNYWGTFSHTYMLEAFYPSVRIWEERT